MRQIVFLFFVLLIPFTVAYSQTNSRHVKVKGYYRKDGTYVRPHYRTAPNSTNRDNFSTRGNTNPYTGERGYVRPDNHASSGSRARAVSQRSSAASVPTNPDHVYVRGYYRRDGTYVRGHYRTAPNSTTSDNYSTRGNVNPYTGEPGRVAPEHETNTSSRNRTTTAYRSPTASTTSHTRRRVGANPNGHIYATTQARGQLWRDASQMDRIRELPPDSWVRVIGYEDSFWKVIADGTTGYVYDATIEVNNDMRVFKKRAPPHPRTVTRPAYTTSTTSSVSRATTGRTATVKYAPLSSAQPGRCSSHAERRLMDHRYVVQDTYLTNRPGGQPMRKLTYGNKVNVLCTEGNWYEVAYEGNTGWVERRLVRE